MMIKFKLLIIVISMFFLSIQPSWASDETTVSLKELIDETLANSPEIGSAGQNIEALKERPEQAYSLPNPMLSFGIANLPVDTFELNQEAMTQKTIGVMQTFPYPGKRSLMKDVAGKELRIGEENLEVLKLRLIREVKTAYFSLFFTNKAIQITERNKDLLRELVRIAETKYSVGNGLQQDVLKAQVELSKLMERLISLKERRNNLKARLNSLMDRLPQAPLGDTEGLEMTELDISVDDLQKRAESRHPAFKILNARIEKEKSQHLLAEKDYYPDFNVSAQYGQRDDKGDMERPDFVSAMVQMRIPLWHKTKEDRKVAETAARIRQSEKDYEAARNGIFLRIKTLKEEMERSYEQAVLFRDGIIPQASASLDSALAGYQVNKVDFLTLQNNQITLYNYEIDYFRVFTDHEIKLAEMEEVVGGNISGKKTD